VIVGVYGVLVLVALTNLLLMRRPRPGGGAAKIAVLIPARNEEANLQRLIPVLTAQNDLVYVFDDESEDGTAEVASSLGARVVRPREPLPKGWTGKNRACHELGKVAAEDADVDWYLFLDADVRPEPDFLDAMRSLCAEVGPRTPVITGIPRVLSGRGVEPLFLAWVGWIILVTNPFGIVARTRMGHNRFTNGQVHCWRAEVYTRLWPNERVRGHVMEDVMMGRILAKEGIPVETANLSRVLSVRMYETWRETLDGMSKNSFEVANSVWGSVALALLMLSLGWLWLLAGSLMPWAYALFALGGVLVALTARASLLPVLVMPLVPTIGAYTILRSTVWRLTGQTRWKGRVYE